MNQVSGILCGVSFLCGIWGVIRMLIAIFSNSGNGFVADLYESMAFTQAAIPPLVAMILFYYMARALELLLQTLDQWDNQSRQSG